MFKSNFYRLLLLTTFFFNSSSIRLFSSNNSQIFDQYSISPNTNFYNVSSVPFHTHANVTPQITIQPNNWSPNTSMEIYGDLNNSIDAIDIHLAKHITGYETKNRNHVPLPTFHELNPRNTTNTPANTSLQPMQVDNQNSDTTNISDTSANKNNNTTFVASTQQANQTKPPAQLAQNIHQNFVNNSIGLQEQPKRSYFSRIQQKYPNVFNIGLDQVSSYNGSNDTEVACRYIGIKPINSADTFLNIPSDTMNIPANTVNNRLSLPTSNLSNTKDTSTNTNSNNRPQHKASANNQDNHDVVTQNVEVLKKKDKIKPFKCNLCNQRFTEKYNLIRHNRSTHEGEKPFKCNLCNKRFAEKYNLIRHKRIHEGQKPFKCHICHRGLSSKVSLKDHLKQHTGKKPHKCGQCPRAFASENGLKQHIRKTHNNKNKKMHSCKYENCNVAFARETDFKSHIKYHENKNDDRNCYICKKFFEYKYNLNRHNKKVHSVSS